MAHFIARGDASHLLSGALAPAPPAGQPIASQTHTLAGPLFASLSWLGGGATAAPQSVKERRTGHVFEGEYCLRAGQRNCPVILGAGARTKRIAGVKNLDVYALALYVDAAAARGALHLRFRGCSSVEALARDQALFDELMRQEGVEKTLRIVVTSGLVKRGSFIEALEERLAPPLAAAGQLAMLEAFTRQFDAAAFRKGLDIAFTFRGGGRLVTRVDGQQVGAIANRALASALLQIYLGRTPVSQGAKDSFGAGLAGMVLAA